MIAPSAPALDLGALEAVMAAELPPGGQALSLERIGGGQSNPTFFVDWGAHRLVLRKQPAGPILKGAHAVDREYRVLSALWPTAVPVPRPVLFHADPAALGTPFYLMERVDGRVFHDCALPGVPPQERRALYLAMAEAMARLHAIEPAAVGLSDFGRPGDYFARQIARWGRQWREAAQEPIPDLDRLMAWLEAHRPVDDGRVAIAHGDFRLGNMLFHPQEPRVVAILDWELSTLGHPLADLGFACMTWRTTPAEYGGIRGLDAAALGLPSEAEFVAAYRAAAVPTPPLTAFHIAFAFFRFAVIFVGIAERAQSGSAVSAEAADLGHLAARFAARGLESAGA